MAQLTATLNRELEFAPVPPTQHVAPRRIGPDTYLIHQVQPALGAPIAVYLNSMVITGDEPVIVDTGTVANRKQWLEDVFGLVDPADVRWVFLSHDDHDHTGNLAEVLALCPNATLIANWAMVERISNAFEFPLHRLRWLNDGESFDAGKRRLVAVRPPNFDSPATRGLFDPTTGIYWAVDAFATAIPAGEAPATIDELDPAGWREDIAMVAYNAVSAWLPLADPGRFAANVARIRSYGMTTIAGAHTPVITGASVGKAFDLVSELPLVVAPPSPDQAVLDSIRSAIAG